MGHVIQPYIIPCVCCSHEVTVALVAALLVLAFDVTQETHRTRTHHTHTVHAHNPEFSNLSGFMVKEESYSITSSVLYCVVCCVVVLSKKDHVYVENVQVCCTLQLCSMRAK